jgi:DNA-binding NarL/FixJ family response regulator
MNDISILIADDHPIFRKGVISICSGDESINIAGEASNGSEAYTLITKLKPDIALLDIDMPGMNGLEVAKKIRNDGIKTKIVILTIYKDKAYFDEAMNLDIKAYVLKDNIANDLVDCIKQVADGDYYISPSISGYLIKSRKIKSAGGELDKLTSAEIEVLKRIAENKTSRQIAEELFRSIRTIENHRNNIISKLSLKGPHALLIFALEYKIELLKY